MVEKNHSCQRRHKRKSTLFVKEKKRKGEDRTRKSLEAVPLLFFSRDCSGRLLNSDKYGAYRERPPPPQNARNDTCSYTPGPHLISPLGGEHFE